MGHAFENYPDYLKSDHWKNLRTKSFERTGYKCEICKTKGVDKKANEVHHINYKNWVDVKLKDLTPVCEECHCKVHLAIKNGFIAQDNKCSFEKTVNGLNNYLSNKKPLPVKKRTTFILDRKIIEEMNDKSKRIPQCMKLLCGIFKIVPPNDWWKFLDKAVSIKRMSLIRKALSKTVKDREIRCKKKGGKFIAYY